MAKLSDEAMLKRTRNDIEKTRKLLRQAETTFDESGHILNPWEQWPLKFRVDDFRSILANLEKREAGYVASISVAAARAAAAADPWQTDESEEADLVKVE